MLRIALAPVLAGISPFVAGRYDEPDRVVPVATPRALVQHIGAVSTQVPAATPRETAPPDPKRTAGPSRMPPAVRGECGGTARLRVESASPPEPPAAAALSVNGIAGDRILVLDARVRDRVKEVFSHGQQRGINARAFSKVGDSTIGSPYFLTRFETEPYDLCEFGRLQGVNDYFAGSFRRDGLARQGFHSWSLFDPMWSDGSACGAGEGPLPCETGPHRPAFLVIRQHTVCIPTMPALRYGDLEWRLEDIMTSPEAPKLRPHFVPPGIGRPFVIAHRGASLRAPENTLSAFRLAWESGADAAELDVQPCRDGTLVVLHDSTIDRTTDAKGRVDRMEPAEVAAARCRLAGEPMVDTIPTLRRALELLPVDKRFLIEVKTRGAALAVLAEIRRTGVLERVGVCSFLASELRALRDAEPDMPLILNLPWQRLFRIDRLIDRAGALGAAGVFLFPNRVSKDIVEHAHALGLEVHAGAVNTADAAGRMVAMGVDALETDDPGTVVPALVTLA